MIKYCAKCKKAVKVWKMGRIPTVKGRRQRYIGIDCGHTMY